MAAWFQGEELSSKIQLFSLADPSIVGGGQDGNLQKPIRHRSHQQAEHRAVLLLLTRPESVCGAGCGKREDCTIIEATMSRKEEGRKKTYLSHGCVLLETTSRSLELPRILWMLHWQVECQSCKTGQGKNSLVRSRLGRSRSLWDILGRRGYFLYRTALRGSLELANHESRVSLC